MSKILVIGDTILDIYLYGDTTRISPEAPVPIVEFHSTKTVLGGAANVANNLDALEAPYHFLTILGNDEYHPIIMSIKQLKGTCVTVDNYNNTVKTRIVIYSYASTF